MQERTFNTPQTLLENYEDLCIHPHLEIPKGFKVPKFDTFSGIENTFAYLRAYCDKFVEVGKNEDF